MAQATVGAGTPGGRRAPAPAARESGPVEDSWEELPPDPASTIESLRSLGYTPGSALADLIDNSVSAGAREVGVVARHLDGGASWIAVVDDGGGMTEERLRRAMRIGSDDPLDVRPEGDLGRFGFGLKTASFSQARELTVLSRRPGGPRWTARSWDLDHVRGTGRWMLRRSPPPGAEPVLARLSLPEAGTVVLWRKLTVMVPDDDGMGDRRVTFQRHLGEVSAHLAMVFGRFLRDGGLRITVNRHRISAWDPFLQDHPATQELPAEELDLRGHRVRVRPFVLPHPSKLTSSELEAAGGPGGWNEQQGFYVYRRDRLVTAGDWLGLGLARDDLHNLARVAVDVPAELDGAWRLDIRKATVRPPDGLRVDLLRIARVTRQRAATVHRHRGTPVQRSSRRHVDAVWVQRALHGGPRLTINRKHPLVARLLADAGPRRRDLSDLLAVVEQTLPVLLLPAGPPEEPPLADHAPEDILRLAETVYEALVAGGLSRAEARQRVANTEPFHLYPSLVEELGGRP